MSSAGGRSRRRRSWRPNPDTALALVALVLAAGGGGYALGAGAADQVISACFEPASGSVPQKIIAGTDCGPGQTALSWNQIGPQGSLGPAGLQGPAGPVGAAGPAGAPATGYQTIVAVGRGPTGDPGIRIAGGFVVTLGLPGPGTYELHGGVGYFGFNGVVGCRITRDRPAQVVDTVVKPVSPIKSATTPIPNNPHVDIQSLEEHTLITVAPPTSSDPATTAPAKVKVSFSCNAPPPFYKRRSTKQSTTTTFLAPRLSATPVSVTTVQKVK